MWMRTGEKQNGKYGGGYERSAKGRVGGIRVGLKKKDGDDFRGFKNAKRGPMW